MIKTDLSLRAEISLFYDLFVPDNLSAPAPLLISVHGYGAHKRYMMREAQRIAPDDFVVVSVQGPHQHYRQTKDGYRVGFGWLTDHNSEEYVALHHEFLLRIIDGLEKEALIDRSGVFLFGFSQACALNFRFAFTHPEVPAAVIGVCGGIPGDLEGNSKYKPFGAHTFYLYGDDDEFYTQDKFKAFDAKLNEILPNYRSKHYVAKHEITDEMRDDMRQFIAEVR